MIRKISIFVAGFLFGFLIDLIPRLSELSLNIYLCREACPSWFRGTSMVTYFAMPIFWGLFAVWAYGRPASKTGSKPKIVALVASLLVILLITWMAYAYHKQMI
ncbi:hypothetical protein [Collimonas sp. OK412]|uniref:hypothetical protein n=1 Tax=Collimonas sp. (strain OK412) TaxID=1801619 RepID=UPI001587A533|nr:hypothetical protein [Collimonas sp. OK412]